MDIYYTAPTFDVATDKWSVTTFKSRKEIIDYLDNSFKYPSQYNIQDSQGVWNKQAVYFQTKGSYPSLMKGSREFKQHWDFEKTKCKFDGFIIYKNSEKNYEFTVPSLYYFYLNYCPIVDKLKSKVDFPEIYDGDYHYFLYVLRAIYKRKYAVVLKKRQCFLEDSVINTNKGFITIKKLFDKFEKIKAFTYNNNNIELDDLINIQKGKKVEKYIKVQTYSGKYLETSLDHRYFVKNVGWKEAKDLKRGDELIEFYDNFGNETITNEEAIFVGYFITDGSYCSKKLPPKFTNTNQFYLDEFENVLKLISPESKITKHKKGNGFDYNIVSKDGSKGTPNLFKRKLEQLGFLEKGANRQLPLKYLNLDKYKTSLLINRMFAANGWCHRIKSKSIRYEIGIASLSPELIQQIQLILNRFSIKSFINKENESFYKLRIAKSEDVNTFIKNIGIFKKTDGIKLSNITVKKTNTNFNKVFKTKIYKKNKQLYDVEMGASSSLFMNGIYVHNSGYTLKNMSIILNSIWFGDAITSKIFSQDESKVKDSWGFMEIYKDHINKNCAWKRGFDPGRKLDWQVRRKLNDGSYIGNLSTVKGFTTKQDPTNGVGGSALVVFGEEAGINSTLSVTHEYITSNVALGGVVTGLIIYSGAVGELEKAESLRKFLHYPRDYDFLPCANNIEDDVALGTEVGFFAPEWWNYVSMDEETQDFLKCYDINGNTKKELALIQIHKARKIAEAKDAASYRYYCSQRPLSITEAFATRKDAIFPARLVHRQIQRIEDKEYALEYVDLYRTEKGEIKQQNSNKLPIIDFPISEKLQDKESVIVIHERPSEKTIFGRTYYASIDPVNEGKTSSTDSLCSIYVYKNDVQVIKKNSEGIEETYIEPGKLVCWWSGRFDDITKTHQRLELIIEYYNAWTLVENNVPAFIRYMMERKKVKYLVPRTQIAFLKELNANLNVYQEYGWKNVGTLFKDQMLNYGLEFMREEIDQEISTKGDVVKVVYGVERLPDIMLMKEMSVYAHGMNADRVVAYCALAAFVKIQNASRGYITKIETSDNQKREKPNLYKKITSHFKNQNNKLEENFRVQKSWFRNLK